MNDKNFIQVSEDLKSLANKFRNIVAVAEMCEKIGSLEQSEKEALGRKEAAQKAEAEAMGKFDSAQAKIDAAMKDVANANSKKGEIENATQVNVQKMVQEAEGKASKIIQEAKAAHADVMKKYKEASNAVEDMKAQVVSKREELAQIQKQMNDVKSKISAFVK